MRRLFVLAFIMLVCYAAKPVEMKIPPMPPKLYWVAIHVTKVAMSEYVDAYLYSDSVVRTYQFNGSVLFQAYSFSGRKIVDLAPGFNQWINLDDQGYVWKSDLSFTGGTRIDLDTFGNAFNHNLHVYGYYFSYWTLDQDSTTIWYWGGDSYNFYHLTGGNTIVKPVKLHSPAGTKFKKLVGGNNLLGLTTTGTVICWNNGDSNYITKTIPAGSTVVDIAASHNDFYILDIHDYFGGNANLGHLYWFGSQNSYVGDVTQRTQPFPLAGILKDSVGNALSLTFAEVVCNDNTFHMRDSINDILGSGDNPNGELGNGRDTVITYPYPTQYAWSMNKGDAYSLGKCWVVLHNGKYMPTGTTLTYYTMIIDQNDSLWYAGRNKSYVLPEGVRNANEVSTPNALDIRRFRMGNGLWHPNGSDQTFAFPTMSAGSPQTVTTNNPTITVSGNPCKVGSYGYAFLEYSWTVISGSAVANSPTSNSTTLTFPSAGSSRVRMTTTDSQGGTDTASVLITYAPTGRNSTPLNRFRAYKRV